MTHKLTAVTTVDIADWLLEDDNEQPGVRYHALQWLLGLPAADPAVVAARRRVMSAGPVPEILAAQRPEGHWEEPRFAFGPQYRGSAWALTFLADLGADGADARVRSACEWVLAHVPAVSGGIGYGRGASKVIHCANGNVTRARVTLGRFDDPRTKRALQGAADATLGRGTPEYRASGTSGPALRLRGER